jgi:hypothetical protein
MEKVEALIERAYPYFWGAVGAIVHFFYASALFVWATSEKVDIVQLFTAVFNMALVLTGFLFTFFGLAIAPGGGFIERLVGTKTFRIFSRYIGEALFMGALSALACVPFMVLKLKEMQLDLALKVAISAWVFVSIAAIGCFYRVARIFLIWVGAGARPFQPRVNPA